LVADAMVHSVVVPEIEAMVNHATRFARGAGEPRRKLRVASPM
jgi:hypothetical protein